MIRGCSLLLVWITGFYGLLLGQDTTLAWQEYQVAKELVQGHRPAEALPHFMASIRGYGETDQVKTLIRIRNHAGSAMLHLGKFDDFQSFHQETHRLIDSAGLDHTSLKSAAYFHDATGPYYRGDFKTALHFFEKSLEVLENAPDARPQYANTTYGMVGACHYNLGNYRLALEYSQAALDANIAALGPDHPLLASGWMNTGAIYFDMGDYRKGLDYFLEAEKVVNQAGVVNDPTILENIYQNIGTSYVLLKEYELAASYMEKASEMKKQTLGEDHAEFASVYLNYASLNFNRGDTAEAMEYFQKAEDLVIRHLGKNSKILADIKGNLAEIRLMKKDYEAARELSMEAIRILKVAEEFPYPSAGINYARLGEAEAGLKNISDAKRWYGEAMKTAADAFGDKGIRAAEIYLAIARFYGLDLGSESILWELTEKAVACVSTANIEFKEGAFPDLENISEPEVLLNAIQLRMDFWTEKIREGQYPGMFEPRLMELALYASDVIEKLRKRYITPEGREALGKTAAGVYAQGIEEGIKAYYDSFEDRDQVFRLIEKGRGNLLSAALNDSRARSFARIPDSLVLYERNLRVEERFLQKELLSLPDTAAKRKNLESGLFQVRDQLTKIDRFLKEEYPEYFDLKYETFSPTADSLMAWAQAHQAAVIEFYTGDSVGAVFVFAGEDFSLFPLRGKLYRGILNNAEALAELMRTPPEGGSSRKMWETYSKLASNLFEALLGRFRFKLARYENWVIIPDGIFHQVPFEALLKAPPGDNVTGFRDAPYVMRYHTLRYAYSAKSLFTHPPAGEDSLVNGTLAMAPSFGGGSPHGGARDLPKATLPFASEEIEGILTQIAGTGLQGSAATETYFRDSAAFYKILHLATHSDPDDKRPVFSHIYLAEDSLNDGILHAYEILNTPLNAELAVLSACNTGSGKFLRGEGVMSLARSFAFAGCPAILMSLWQVDDQATSRLMQNYYRELAGGQPKDLALRNAKIRFLEEADEGYAHPFFWAGFVQYGDPMPLQGGDPAVWWILGLLVVGLAGLLIYDQQA